MIIRPFDKKKDLAQVIEWANKRGDQVDPDLFPPDGIICPGVAAYFLYITPSKAAWAENLITNPDTDPGIRDVAIRYVTNALCLLAREKGIKVLFATTDINKVIQRAHEGGCDVKLNQTLLTFTL